MFQMAKQMAFPNTARNIHDSSTFGCVNSGVRFGMPSVMSMSGMAVMNAQKKTRRVTRKLSYCSV